MTTGAPKVMFGTKWPSMISICSQSASQSMALRHSAPNTAKSAERIEGAIIGRGDMANVCCARLITRLSVRWRLKDDGGQIDSSQVAEQVEDPLPANLCRNLYSVDFQSTTRSLI